MIRTLPERPYKQHLRTALTLLLDLIVTAAILLSIYYFNYLVPHRFDTSHIVYNSAAVSDGSGALSASGSTGKETITYYIADVYTSNINCFRTYFAQDTYGAGYTEHLTKMSRDVHSILAMNGDSYCYNRQHTAGILIRNGTLYRSEPTTSDVCILYPVQSVQCVDCHRTGPCGCMVQHDVYLHYRSQHPDRNCTGTARQKTGGKAFAFICTHRQGNP